MLGLQIDSGPAVHNVHSNMVDDSRDNENPWQKSGPGTAMPIAICGMSLRLPGGSTTPEEFFDFLLNKGDARTRVGLKLTH